MDVTVEDIKPGCLVRTNCGSVFTVDEVRPDKGCGSWVLGRVANDSYTQFRESDITEIIATAQEVDHGDGTVTRVMTLPVTGEAKALDQTKGLRLVGTGYAPGCERLTHAEFYAEVGPVEREPTPAERELAESDWPLLYGNAVWLTLADLVQWKVWKAEPRWDEVLKRYLGKLESGELGYFIDPRVHPRPDINVNPADSLIELSVVRRLREEAGR